MAFLTLVVKEMSIKTTAFLILINVIIIRVSHGHLGCADSLVPCLNRTHCINIEQVCVDYHDCVDEHGDKICTYCQPGEKNSIACVTHVESQLIFECLSPNQICDDKKDCINNEDEHLCGINKCKLGHWLCTNGTCIEKSRMCDTKRDCPDGSDEGDFCIKNLCEPNKIRCPTGECILKSKVCDGFSHCSDGYDEQDCTHFAPTIKDSCSISSDTFTCSTSSTLIHPICISNDRVCDGYKDCPMGDDEHDCSNKCTSDLTCTAYRDVTCIQHPALDQLCRCNKQGYRLTTNPSNNHTQICQDFDECNDPLGTYCSFNCSNTDGSYKCTCPSGFTIDETTKTCRRINDLSKPNLLILHDDNIILYDISATTDVFSSKSINTIIIDRNHHFDFIQYDPYQMFVIYYDQYQHAILCKSNTTLNTIVLLSNIIVHGFAYNANEKSLFIIENQSRTLRMYTSITCGTSYHMKMHSWPFKNFSNAIQSMEIDIFNRQIIFASKYQFMISNMSEPNSPKVVYTADREIKRFIYDASFKRIFWTAVNISNNELFPVYTCDDGFKQCLATSIRLPSAWPFAFFDDGLFYSPLSTKSLNIVQLFGKNRFSNAFITSMRENVRSFLIINYAQTQLSNLCVISSTARCKNELCLQINQTETTCLSISDEIISSPTNTISLVLRNPMQSLVTGNLVSQAADQQKKYRYRPSNFILFCIVITGIAVTILAVFVKRWHKRLNKKTSDAEQRLYQRNLSIDEPNLDEFSVSTDDRNGVRLPLTNQLHY